MSRERRATEHALLHLKKPSTDAARRLHESGSKDIVPKWKSFQRVTLHGVVQY